MAFSLNDLETANEIISAVCLQVKMQTEHMKNGNQETSV